MRPQPDVHPHLFILKRASAFLLALLLSTPSCTLKQIEIIDGTPARTPVTAANLLVSSWTPSATGAGTSNYKHVTYPITKTVITASSKPMVRLNDPWVVGAEITVDLGTYVQADFGPNGSMTLVADTLNYPISYGGAYPVLISFYVDTGSGTQEFINTRRAGAGGDCRQSGMWSCVGGSCTANSNCTVDAPSAYADRTDWDQHQIPSYGYTSTNRLPGCDSTGGSPWNNTECPAGISPDASGMPAGHYYAKYVLMSDYSGSLAGKTATLQVTLFRRTDSTARNTGGSNGAVDINIILVGDQNVNDSHTARGAQNLNLLFGEVNSILQANANVSLGNVRAYEWTDANGGDQYSTTDLDYLGDLFEAGSLGVPSTYDGKAINVFIVSDIPYSGAGVTILGLSGGILGPITNGTQTSGLAFSSFNELQTFNNSTGCTLGSCTRDKQESDFLEMGATIAHELGHYLGLNHPSEKRNTGSTQRHDSLTDTPKCIARVSGASYVLDARACYVDTAVGSQVGGQSCQAACPTYFTVVGSTYTLNTFCPAITQCQFNHVMWYTTKNRRLNSGTHLWEEDGNLISSQSSALLQWNSFVQ